MARLGASTFYKIRACEEKTLWFRKVTGNHMF